jgi:hypothetical protein
MNRSTRIALALGMTVVAASALAGCSSSSSSSETAAASASASLVGGMTECTEENVTPAAEEAATALGADNAFTLETLDCSDGWAVASGILGTKDDPTTGAPTAFIFQAEGQFWVPQAPADVCGSDPAASAAPADATIPADLYLAGCATN